MEMSLTRLQKCISVLYIIVTTLCGSGCALPQQKEPLRTLQLSLQFSQDGSVCTVSVFNPTDRPLEYYAQFADSFEVKVISTNYEVITSTEDSMDGWWGLGRLSSKLTPTPLNMEHLAPHTGVKRIFNVRKLLEEFGRRYQLEPSNAVPHISSVAAKCRIITQPEVDSWIESGSRWHHRLTTDSRPWTVDEMQPQGPG